MLNYCLKIVKEYKNWAWHNYVHTYNIYLLLSINNKICYVLVVVVFNKFKCMCMSYIIINSQSSWIERY
jgi:hypothetical protein